MPQRRCSACWPLAFGTFGSPVFLRQRLVTVTHADGTTAEFAYHTDLEYLGDLLQQEGLISGSEGEYGLFVETVDGEPVDYHRDQSWWRLTCNGEDATTGADAVVLHDGDQYAWFYTTG